MRVAVPGVCKAGHALGEGNRYIAFPGTRKAQVRCLACLDGINRDPVPAQVWPAALAVTGGVVPLRCPARHVVAVTGTWVRPATGEVFCKACTKAANVEAARRLAVRRAVAAGDAYPLEHWRIPFHANVTVEEEDERMAARHGRVAG